jgi:hypothetical protein
MAIAVFIARSSKRLQSSAAYLILFASSFLAKLMIPTLIQETDQLTHAIRRLLPSLDIRAAKALILVILCSFTIAANYTVFRIIARSTSSPLSQKLRMFAIWYVLPILFFSLLAAGK